MLGSQQTNNVPRHRVAIQNAIDHLFQCPVVVDERTFQAIEVVSLNGRTPKPIHIWTSLTKSLPAISRLHEAIGYKHSIAKSLNLQWTEVGKLKNFDPSVHDEAKIKWGSAIRGALCIEDPNTGGYALTEAATVVKKTGYLGVDVLVRGLLQSGQIEKGGTTRRANLVLRNLLRGTGRNNGRHWNSSFSKFSQRAIDAFDYIARSDESFGTQQFLLYYDREGFRIRPFGTVGTYQLDSSPLEDGSLWVARGNIVQPSSRFTDSSITALENLINLSAPESDFQDFFEEHSEFLMALGSYDRIHPHLILERDVGGKLIPDFFLEKLNSKFCDICDLKRPIPDLVRRQKNRLRFRDAVMEAVAQLTEYRDWFDTPHHREKFHSRYGLSAFRPRAVAIIGRRQSFVDEIDRIKLESGLPSWIELKTYDDILQTAQQWKRLATE